MLIQGLSTKKAAELLQIHGENILKETGKEPLWKKFLAQFLDFMVLTLVAAAIIALVIAFIEKDFTEMVDAYMIIGIVILNAIIGFIQEFKSEKAIEALRKMTSPHAKVLRNGKLQKIEARLIVPGDMLILEAGDKVSADAILLESNELKIDESILTGESHPVHKKKSDTLFMGTSIVNGTAKARVADTGMNTEFGKIAHLTVSTKKDKTPLQKELRKVGVFIGKVALLISIILFIIGFTFQGQTLTEALLFAVAVAVAAVPEGLPAIVTITLAIGVQKLAKKKAIIKQLSSVETLGSTTVICSDKTGTLTQNEMTVKEILLGSNNTINVSGVGYDSKSGKIEFPKNYDQKTARLLLQISSLCNNAHLEGKKIVGDPTEGALQTLTSKGKKNLSLSLEQFKRVHEFPFDSNRKRMSVLVNNQKQNFVFSKGAPDSILKICTHILINGKKIKLTNSHKKEILKKEDEMAKKALRILGFAYKETSKKKLSEKTAEKYLTFVGLAGMIDPPRKEVPQAIKLCKKAGIHIIIITGDYGPTALAIGKKIGVVNNETHLYVGDDLEKMTDKKLETILKKSKNLVFARIKPVHKLRIVEALKQQNEIVAVTGDGVNDAPALKRADIGVAMGISGTEVSKEASNMILTDDSFASIISAISQGRAIYENLKKFIWFILSSNIGEVLTIFLAIVFFLPSPFTALLILAVNVGTDILPALALGLEKPEKYIMDLPPRNPKKRILCKKFVLRMFYIGTCVSIVVIGVYIWTLSKFGWQWGTFPEINSFMHLKATTAAFAALVITQLFNALNARSEKSSIFKLPINIHLIGAIAISVAIVLAIIELPLLQNLFHTTGLSFSEWIIVILASSLILFIEEARKQLVK